MSTFLRCLTFVLALALAPAALAQTAKIPVVATFSVIGDIAAEVGAGRIEVTTLVPVNGDAHTYQPNPGDAKTLAGARLVVVNGLGMEGWINRLVKASGYKGPLITASRGVKPQTMDHDDDDDAVAKSGHKVTTPKKVNDPHAWQNALNGVIYARNIEAGLVKIDPDGAAAYHAAADAYVAQLKETDGWIRAEIGKVAPDKRKIITSHDAFGYFGTAYGVTFEAPQGISTESEPSAGDVAKLVRQIKAEGIKAIFIENMTDPRLIEQIARESGAVVGGTVYSDALSVSGGPADTYVKMFRHNVPLFVSAMQRN